MPAIVKILTQEGLQDAPYSATSLADAAHHEPYDGVYTVTNTYPQLRTLKLDAHLDRMESSAHLAGMQLNLDRPHLRAALRQMIVDSGYGDVRFRITAPRVSPHQLILTIEPYQPPSDKIIQAGVCVITVPNSARHDAAAKTTNWLHDRERIELSLHQDVYTALLLDTDGYVMEGLSSNFYAIQDGVLRTAGHGVLGGIAQQILFEIAPPILPLRKEAVHVHDLPHISEAFITSSSRGIIPVVKIDALTITDGQPGTYTRRLRNAYVDWAQAHLEPL